MVPNHYIYRLSLFLAIPGPPSLGAESLMNVKGSSEIPRGFRGQSKDLDDFDQFVGPTADVTIAETVLPALVLVNGHMIRDDTVYAVTAHFHLGLEPFNRFTHFSGMPFRLLCFLLQNVYDGFDKSLSYVVIVERDNVRLARCRSNFNDTL